MNKKAGVILFIIITLLSAIYLLTNEKEQTNTPKQATATAAATADNAVSKTPTQVSSVTPHTGNTTNTKTNTSTHSTTANATTITTENNHKNTQTPKQQHFDPNADYTYSSPIMANAMQGLNALNHKRQTQAYISEAEVTQVWQYLDAAQKAGFLEPIETLLHKEWLVSLVPQATQLQQKFAHERATTRKQLMAKHQKQQQASATDPKFLAYKAAEKRITKEIMAQYPHDLDKASAELGKALDEVRSQIYNDLSSQNK